MTEPTWRVEELAEVSGTSVDTIRFYQKRRLLDAPRRDGRIAWYGPEHVERLARIRELRLRGLTLALIGRLVRGELDATDEPLATAVATAAASSSGSSSFGTSSSISSSPTALATTQSGHLGHTEELISLAELAVRSGVPVEMLGPVINAGLLAPTTVEGEARFMPGDVRVLQAGLELIGAGLPMNDVLNLARTHHERTRATAEEAVAMFDAHIRTPLRDSDLNDPAKAQRLVDAFRVMLPAVTTLVEQHFRQVLLAVAQEHLESVGDPEELAAVHDEAERMNDGAP